MRQNYTHISILLDRSGSMFGIKEDIIGGFNQLIEEQKKVEGELTITLAAFSSPNDYNLLYEMTNINNVKPLTLKEYHPNGPSTALNDSFVKLINDTGNTLAKMPEFDRPEKVLIVTLTDGMENDSKEYGGKSGLAELRNIILHQELKYNWQFLYIGANQDSFKEATSRGVRTSMNFTTDSAGIKNMYAKMSSSFSKYRSGENLNKNTTSTNNNGEGETITVNGNGDKINNINTTSN